MVQYSITPFRLIGNKVVARKDDTDVICLASSYEDAINKIKYCYFNKLLELKDVKWIERIGIKNSALFLKTEKPMS